MQLAMEQAERDKAEAEERGKRDADRRAASNNSALDRLQQEFETKEQALRAEAAQALQSAYRECKVGSCFFRKIFLSAQASARRAKFI